MNATAISNSLKSRAKLTEEARAHPFVQAYLDRKETLDVVATWLTKKLGHRVPKSTLQSWYKPVGAPGWRPIPEDAERALRARYKLPLTAFPKRSD